MLLLSMFAIITVFLIFIAMPIFFRLNKIRREYWLGLFDHIRKISLSVKIQCIDRLS
jgi:hypothetical protein